MRVVFLTLLLLCLASFAWAQPWGPWTVAQVPSGMSLSNPQVCLRNSDTADVFYQVADTIFHVTVDVTTGIIYPPSAFPLEGTGWSRRLCDVVSTSEGWAALVYDTTANLNRTTVFRGRDALDADSVIDSGVVMYSGEWVSVSINHALALSPRRGGGFFAVWLNEWAYDDPWFWGEAGWGPVAREFVSSDTVREAANYVSGIPYTEMLGATLELFGVFADSAVLMINSPPWIEFWSVLWQSPWGPPEIHSTSSLSASAVRVGTLMTHGGTIFLVSRSFSGSPAKLLRVDSLSTCAEVRTLNDEPIAAASDPDFGIAWLAWHGPAILLCRTDTTGAEYLPEGTVHWPVRDSVIAEAAVGMSHEGRLAAVWSERVAGSANATLLRMKSLEWDTPLSARDRDFILPPSSFILSAFPNPFNSALKIEYTLPRSGNIEVSVYNVLGQKVETLVRARQEAGNHSVMWSPKMAGGVYFVTLKTDKAVRTEKVLYLR